MRRVIIAVALCVALGSAPAQALEAHGGPHGGGNQYPYWYTASGQQMPPALIRSYRLRLEHCFPDVTMLQLGNVGGSAGDLSTDPSQPPADAPAAGIVPLATARQYVSDPRGSFPAQATAGPYTARAEMPYDAVNTGLHQDGKDLYFARDGQSVYLVGDHGVERWPAFTSLNLACD